MRFVKTWLLAAAGVFASLSTASALPVPKLPPEATDKPSVVVRIRPVDELMRDAAYVARMTGQQDNFDAFKPGMDPVIECIDGRKPIGFYAKIGPNGTDSYGIALVPVKNQQDTIKLLNNLLGQIGLKVEEGNEGLYTINLPPFGIAMRFANGYLYATVKNTPEAEAALAAAKLYQPQALFAVGDESLVSVTINADTIPNELKRQGIAGLEGGLKQFKAQELAKEPNAAVRALMETVADELAGKVQLLMTDTKTVTLRFDFDRLKEDMALSFRLTPRADTDLSSDLSILGAGKSLTAGLLTPNALLSVTGNIAAPASVKKALDPLIDEAAMQIWKKAKPEEQALVKELTEILTPALKAGLLDFAVEFRGPNTKNEYTVLAALNVKDADRLDPFVRKIFLFLPEEKKRGAKLDVDKAGAVALHQFPADKSPEAFGPDPKVIVAFRKDAIMIGFGPASDAIAAVLGGVNSSPVTSPVLEAKAGVRKIAEAMDKAEPGIVDAAKKAFPPGSNDTYRLTVTGGQSLDVRFSASTRAIQFSALLEQVRRAR